MWHFAYLSLTSRLAEGSDENEFLEFADRQAKLSVANISQPAGTEAMEAQNGRSFTAP